VSHPGRAGAGGSGSILYVDNSEGTTLTLVDAAHAPAFTPDGKTLFVSNTESDTVTAPTYRRGV